MKISYEPSAVAWQPITPGGVASFALAKAGRLWVVQAVVGLIVAVVVVWFLHSRWYPAVLTAVKRLPASGEIRNGELFWRGPGKTELARGGYLAVGVNVVDAVPLDQTADVAWMFGRWGVKVYSVLGYWEMEYPKGWVIAFNRRELEPWLGAWEPFILGGVLVCVWGGLLLIWQVMAAFYAAVMRVMGLYANRRLGFGGLWRLAGAALMPAALFNTAAILAYGFELVDLPRLLAATVMHFVVGWVYVLVSPVFLPVSEQESAARGNPFAGGDSDQRRSKSGNVFSG